MGVAMSHPNKSRMFMIVSLLLVMFAGLAMAQSTNGTIAGVVTDNSGAVVPGAAVSATGVASGETRTTVTGNSGEYRIESLTPGPYVITVKASGFATTKIEGVIVRTSVITSNNVSLQVASANEEVTVAAAADTIQTES